MTREQGAKILALIEAGEELSNVIYNTSGPGGRNEPYRKCVEKWDIARMAVLPLLVELRNLPPAFDPIDLGV